MPTFNDYGIVLNSYNFSESDKILNIYTKESGLVKAIGKGCRKSTSKLRGKVEQLSCCYFQFAKGKNLATICDCEQVNSFSKLRSNLGLLAYGILFLEIVSNFAHEEESESVHIYDLLYSSLNELQSISNPDLFSIGFITQFLSIHGLTPQFETCVSCSEMISTKNNNQFTYYYSSILGGLLCTNCSGLIQHKSINPNVPKILRQYSYDQISDTKQANPSESISKQDIRLTFELLKDHLDIRSKNKIKTFDLVFSL